MGVKAPSEAEFTRVVIDLARLHGWRGIHLLPGMNRAGKWRTAVQWDGAGWPDLFMVHPATGRRLAAELKSPRGVVKPEQAAWLGWLEAAGVEVHTWRPDQWDEIVAVLGPRTAPPPPSSASGSRAGPGR